MVAARLATLEAHRPAKTVGISTVTQTRAADLLNVSRETVVAARVEGTLYKVYTYVSGQREAPRGVSGRSQAVVRAGLTIIGLCCEIVGALLLWYVRAKTRGMTSNVNVQHHTLDWYFSRGMTSDVDVQHPRVDWYFPLGVAVIAQGVCFQLLAAVLPSSP
jgi:hypothetical protein